MIRGASVICSIEGAGVVAVAVAAEACRHCRQTYCGAGLMERRSCFAAGWRRSLGAMSGCCGCGCRLYFEVQQLVSECIAVREEQSNASRSRSLAPHLHPRRVRKLSLEVSVAPPVACATPQSTHTPPSDRHVHQLSNKVFVQVSRFTRLYSAISC